MIKKVLPQYSGQLNSAEIAAGINAAISNAKRLLDDAHLLFQHERFASSAAICVLAIEEAGKISILRGLSTCNRSEEFKKSWRSYRNHRHKNVSWILPDLARDGAKTLNQLRKCVDTDAEHTTILDAVKQIGFYTDCIGNKRNWSIPTEVIDQSTSSSLLKVAQIMCEKKPVTEKEIELWSAAIKEHGHSKEAMLTWQKNMIDAGLSETSLEKWEEFLSDFDEVQNTLSCEVQKNGTP